MPRPCDAEAARLRAGPGAFAAGLATEFSECLSRAGAALSNVYRYLPVHHVTHR